MKLTVTITLFNSAKLRALCARVSACLACLQADVPTCYYLEIKSSAKVKQHLLNVTILSQMTRYQLKRLVSFFVNVASTLEIKYEKFPSNYDASNYNLDEVIIRYNDHPSILAIKNKCMESNSTFTFKKIDKEQISTAIKRLDF